MFYQTLSEAKKTARSLTRNTPEGVELTYGQALDIVAALHGCVDWNAFCAQCSKAAVDRLLAAHERDHAWDAEESLLRAEEQGFPGFGPEVAVVTQSGFRLHAPAFPAECDYVRVCDPLGRETSYWSQQEWQESPAEVMGALVGALTRGMASTNVRAVDAVPQVTLQDVDLERVSAIGINGVIHRVIWCEAAPAKRLQEGKLTPRDDLAEDDEEDIEVFTIAERDRHGFPETVWIWWSELVGLKWSAHHECFLHPKGAQYTFFFETKFTPGV